MFRPETASIAAAQGDLLRAWLAADTSEDREALLSENAALVTAEWARELLALAGEGPSYGPDRASEARFQRELLALTAAVAERAGDPGAAGEASRQLAACLGGEGDPVTLLKRAALLAEKAGDARGVLRAERDLAGRYRRAGRPFDAFAAYERGLKACHGDDALAPEAEALLSTLGRLGIELGYPRSALKPMSAWLEHCRQRGDREATGHASLLLGRLHLTLGNAEAARGLLQEAAALTGEMGDDEGLVLAHLQLLEAALALGEVDASARHIEELTRLRPRALSPDLLAQLDELLGPLS